MLDEGVAILFYFVCVQTHAFAEEELISQSPVVHAQTVGEDQGLEGVGHDFFFGQEVVAEELLHPAVGSVFSFTQRQLISLCTEDVTEGCQGEHLLP